MDEEITYHITLRFNKKISSEKVANILKEHFHDENVLNIDGHDVVARWSVPWYEGIGELENGLYYVLEGGLHGDLIKVDKISGNENLYDHLY